MIGGSVSIGGDGIIGNDNILIVHSDGSNINPGETNPKPHTFFSVMLEHPIISGIIVTVIGGIILAFALKKYFPNLL